MFEMLGSILMIEMICDGFFLWLWKFFYWILIVKFFIMYKMLDNY